MSDSWKNEAVKVFDDRINRLPYLGRFARKCIYEISRLNFRHDRSRCEGLVVIGDFIDCLVTRPSESSGKPGF